MLSSGSGGNATYISSGKSALLVDSGLSCRELERRLAQIDTDPGSIDAIAITHEHVDHVAGVLPLSSRYEIPVHASAGTVRESPLRSHLDRINKLKASAPFTAGCLEVVPFPVPHDAAEPIGFTVSDGAVKVGVATDLGSQTLEVLASLAESDVVLLESNHDVEMLIDGPYPWFVKERIASPLGHLSNEDAADLIRAIRHAGLRHLVLVHLSETNNDPAITLESARKALGRKGAGVEISLGWQHRVGDTIVLD
ncbi:MAG: MBL fold metallo-hydrolase [Actinobacteria bacterium]|nr:MBL fold metallo-hydrolase [Actinomycetota bacterium]